MSYEFDSASSEYLEWTAPVTAAPLTISFWFKVSSLTVDTILVRLQDASATDDDYYSIELSGTVASDPLRGFAKDTFTGTVSVYGTPSVGVWYHAAFVIGSATSRILYMNGVASSEETTSRTPDFIDLLSVGAARDATPQYSDCHIAGLSLWSSALSATDILRLSRGENPNNIDSANLDFYAPLFDDTTDDIGGLTATVGGTPVQSSTDHPNIGSIIQSKYMAGGLVFGE